MRQKGNMKHLRIHFAICCGFLFALAVWAGPAQHTITATLNYDFTSDNACSATVTTGCVKQFNIYDLAGATPVKLFTIAAPSGANSAVTGISGSSAAITLKSGSHAFGATAYDGLCRNDPLSCKAARRAVWLHEGASAALSACEDR